MSDENPRSTYLNDSTHASKKKKLEQESSIQEILQSSKSKLPAKPVVDLTYDSFQDPTTAAIYSPKKESVALYTNSLQDPFPSNSSSTQSDPSSPVLSPSHSTSLTFEEKTNSKRQRGEDTDDETIDEESELTEMDATYNAEEGAKYGSHKNSALSTNPFVKFSYTRREIYRKLQVDAVKDKNVLSAINSYLYRNLPKDEEIQPGWSIDNELAFQRVLNRWLMHNNHSVRFWGIFSLEVPGKTGQHCSDHYKNLMNRHGCASLLKQSETRGHRLTDEEKNHILKTYGYMGSADWICAPGNFSPEEIARNKEQLMQNNNTKLVAPAPISRKKRTTTPQPASASQSSMDRYRPMAYEQTASTVGTLMAPPYPPGPYPYDMYVPPPYYPAYMPPYAPQHMYPYPYMVHHPDSVPMQPMPSSLKQSPAKKQRVQSSEKTSNPFRELMDVPSRTSPLLQQQNIPKQGFQQQSQLRASQFSKATMREKPVSLSLDLNVTASTRKGETISSNPWFEKDISSLTYDELIEFFQADEELQSYLESVRKARLDGYGLTNVLVNTAPGMSKMRNIIISQMGLSEADVTKICNRVKQYLRE
jgi:hypothetical protein